MSRAYAHQNSGNLRDDGNYTAAGKGQVCLPTAAKNQQFRKIKAVVANQVCFDCPATRPTWASVTYGAYLMVIVEIIIVSIVISRMDCLRKVLTCCCATHSPR